MKAPSEKHLEDWIVNHPDHIEIQEDNTDLEDYWDGSVNIVSKVIARQTRLPSGISDLIVLTNDEMCLPWNCERSVAVMEIKQAAIDTKTLAQTLRYMRDIREIFYWARIDFGSQHNYYPDVGILRTCNGQTPEITGIMIGNTLADPNILIACQSCLVIPILYDYDPPSDQYRFQLPEIEFSGHEACESYKEFSYGAIGEAMRVVMQERLERHQFFKSQRLDKKLDEV